MKKISLHHLFALALIAFVALPVQAGEAAYAPEEQVYISNGETTRRVAETYFDAYIRRDWTAIEGLISEDGGFSDPTSEQIFGTKPHRGKEETIKAFRSGYAGITAMSANITRTVFSSSYALFEGTLDWTLKLQSGKTIDTKEMPIVVILTIKDGKVVDHKDYADYRSFIEAFRRVRAN